MLINALKSAQGDVAEQLHAWINKKEFDRTAKVNAVKHIYEQLEIKALTERAIQRYFDKAYQALEAIDIPADRKNNLKEFADYLYHRDK